MSQSRTREWPRGDFGIGSTEALARLNLVGKMVARNVAPTKAIAVIHTDKSDLTSGNPGASEPSYCPECGQSLTLTRQAPEHRSAVARRSLFLLIAGLCLAMLFGRDAWRADQRAHVDTACPSAERPADCVALPHDLALMIASGNISTGEAFAARTAEIELGYDVRYAAAGLMGVVTGVAAVVLRKRQARPGLLAAGANVWLTLEGLLTVFYLEILAIGAYQLVANMPVGAPLTLGRLSDSLFWALSRVFALVGLQ
jgi:hypothetical protein